MSYYIARTVDLPFDLAIDSVVAELAEQGFGILSDIDVGKTLEEKLGEPFRPYRILGACNPPFARQALEAESRIGTMLPCNVVVQQKGDQVEIVVNCNERPQALANDLVVVHDEHADLAVVCHALSLTVSAVQVTTTEVPTSCSLDTTRCAPTSSARSCMISMPMPPGEVTALSKP